jgi:hypothetical protein
MLIIKDKKGRVIGANKPKLIGSRFCIRPNYIVRTNVWHSDKERTKLPPRSTDKNLLDNSHTGEMSEQSQKKIRCAINWLALCARQKWINETPEHKGFYFKINFITLTLPVITADITQDNIHKLLLAPFLDYARKTWGLSSYVWKIELQKNGNPHIHITTDTYIHWTKLRNYWNKLCSNYGLTQQYTAKYLNCKFPFYLEHNPATDLVSVANRYEQWQHGTSIGFSSPNTTDVHSVKNIKDIAAYVSKYMAKDLSSNIKTLGLSALAAPQSTARMWGCSYSLSKAYNTSDELLGSDDDGSYEAFYKGGFVHKQILGKPDRAGIQHPIADVIFLRPHHWQAMKQGRLYRIFASVKSSIQNEYRSPHVVSQLAPQVVTLSLN